MTAQGHPRANFSRAIENGNLVVAEQVAREVPNLTLEEALRLLFLYAEKDPIKYDRAALRWLARYLHDGKDVTLLKAQTTSGLRAPPWPARRRRTGGRAGGLPPG